MTGTTNQKGVNNREKKLNVLLSLFYYCIVSFSATKSHAFEFHCNNVLNVFPFRDGDTSPGFDLNSTQPYPDDDDNRNIC